MAAACARSEMRFMPTSMTVAPGLMNSRGDHGGPADGGHQDVRLRGTRPAGRPSSNGRWSPWRARAAAGSAIGLPTRSLRPTTTARRPAMGISYRLQQFHDSRRACRACGPGGCVTRFPTFSGWRPSTSFSGEMASRTRLASTCAGQRHLHQDAVDLLPAVQTPRPWRSVPRS